MLERTSGAKLAQGWLQGNDSPALEVTADPFYKLLADAGRGLIATAAPGLPLSLKREMIL